MANRPSAFIYSQVPGELSSAYLFWSGRDRDNNGDNTLLANNIELIADEEYHGESGGGSWWHTYMVDASSFLQPLVSAARGSLTLEISGLTFDQNQEGDNHGVSLLILYDAEHCPESQINVHFGLDSFKHSSPDPMYGPDSAVTCTWLEPSQLSRQLDFSFMVGGVTDAERDSIVWIATTSEQDVPETLVDQDLSSFNLIKFLDPLGNDPAHGHWDYFQTTIDLPAGHTQACMQIQASGEQGISGTLVNVTARVIQPSEPTPTINGYIWLDVDQDGLRDPEETGMANVLILLRDIIDDSILQAFVTPDSGEFYFSNLDADAYWVDVADELFDQDWVQTYEADGVLDTRTQVEFLDEQLVEGINFGFTFREPAGSIAGFLWKDLDGNGMQEENEPGLEMVTISLLDNNQNLIAEQSTSDTGTFSFNDLARQHYTVQVHSSTLPPGLIQAFEADNTLDGLVDIDLTSRPDHLEVAFGYGTTGQIQGRMWSDQNENGVVDSDEIGIHNALILLTDESGVGRLAITQDNGTYYFDQLMPGQYYLFVVPDTILPGAIPTYEMDGVLDGQVLVGVGISQVITNVDFGFHLAAHSTRSSGPRLDLSAIDLSELGIDPAGIDLSNIDLTDDDAIIELLETLIRQSQGDDSTDPAEAGDENESGGTDESPEPDPSQPEAAPTDGGDLDEIPEEPTEAPIESDVPFLSGQIPEEEFYQILIPLIR
ncbi:MAG: SdrD B-like domain-containing protein [Chloroflexota bacterium]